MAISPSETRSEWIRTAEDTARDREDRGRHRSAMSTVRPSQGESPSSRHSRAAVSRQANAPGASANCAATTARFSGEASAP
ncbi:hypothetical protein [Streptomonospora alba]|uniref:hypothetical protein n=1 Tax=Streptomonospora alba TaxID=183763 RepID=UPI0012EED5C6|nr:hypothetical protein [Streptomonospora alba]